MAEPVLTPELLAAYREVVAASDADAKLPPRKREHVTGPALAAVFALGPKAYGIEGMARVIVAQADEVARLTEAVRVAERAAAKVRREAYADVARWLSNRLDHPDSTFVHEAVLREILDVLMSGEVPRG